MVKRAEIILSIKLYDENGNMKEVFPSTPIVIGKQDLSERASDDVVIGAGSTNVECSLGQVNAANLLAIITDQNITFKRNSSSGEAIPIVADKIEGNTKYGIFLLTTSDLTSLFFTNSGSSAANVSFLAVY